MKNIWTFIQKETKKLTEYIKNCSKESKNMWRKIFKWKKIKFSENDIQNA